jgi:mRNA interferase MazF
VVISQGEIWWADLPAPTGSEPGFRRPVLIVQGDGLNFSRIATVVCVPLTGNLRWAQAPGNVLLRARATGLPKDSIANVSQIITLDRAQLLERAGRISRPLIDQVFAGIDVILGR